MNMEKYYMNISMAEEAASQSAFALADVLKTAGREIFEQTDEVPFETLRRIIDNLMEDVNLAFEAYQESDDSITEARADHEAVGWGW